MEMEEHGKNDKYKTKTQHLNLGLTRKRNRVNGADLLELGVGLIGIFWS